MKLIAIIFGILGLWFIFVNWGNLFEWVRKKKSASGVPFLGEIFLSIAIYNIPDISFKRLWWIPFILYYSCLPGIICKLITLIKANRK